MLYWAYCSLLVGGPLFDPLKYYYYYFSLERDPLGDIIMFVYNIVQQ